MVVAAPFALLIGTLLGLLGGGGSILTVPVFVYVLGIDAKSAIAMSLAVVGIASLIGGVTHWRNGNVHVRVAALFGAAAMIGAYAGARLSVLLTGAQQMALFAIVMLAAALFMLRDRRPDSRREMQLRWQAVLIGVAAIGVGALTGLVGVGGGFMIVPTLVLLGGLEMKQAVGTSLPVIALNSAVGFYGHVGHVEIAWAFIALFTVLVTVGVLGGAKLMRYVPQQRLRQGFALLLVVIGGLILYQNRSVIGVAADGHTAVSEVTQD